MLAIFVDRWAQGPLALNPASNVSCVVFCSWAAGELGSFACPLTAGGPRSVVQRALPPKAAIILINWFPRALAASDTPVGCGGPPHFSAGTTGGGFSTRWLDSVYEQRAPPLLSLTYFLPAPLPSANNSSIVPGGSVTCTIAQA